MIKTHEVQEFEAWVRSVLSFWEVNEETIDSLIKDDVYIQAMGTETLLENVLKGNDMTAMDDGAGTEKGKTQQPKAFEIIIKKLAVCHNIASQLKIRTRKLASVYIGRSEPVQEDTCEKLEIDSAVLVHVLEDSLKTLEESLNETSDNLEKLENAW